MELMQRKTCPHPVYLRSLQQPVIRKRDLYASNSLNDPSRPRYLLSVNLYFSFSPTHLQFKLHRLLQNWAPVSTNYIRKQVFLFVHFTFIAQQFLSTTLLKHTLSIKYPAAFPHHVMAFKD